ncbi:MAG: fatty acid desaturase [Planctomycetota bacterium]|nr:fatty acid desaturase [Planctomycetota bacterium]
MPDAKPASPASDPTRLINARLLRASKTYAQERRWLSWFHLWSTLAIFATLIAVACMQSLPLLARGCASIVAGMTLIRVFILYHDFQHGTILKGSWVAKVVMTTYGLVALNPPSIWTRSHNHHHKNNAKIFGASIGSYPVMTVSAWGRASRGQRIGYIISRHPLTIFAGYLTIFLYGMCLRSLMASPREHLDSGVSLVVHGGLIALALSHGVDTLLLGMMVPCWIAAAAGAYLFYAQHNYPGAKLHDRAAWDYVAAATESSSHLQMSRLMNWFTGNIGYHHLHHLNARIPFYRLPEAMAGLPEMQSPGTTTLSVGDIVRCFSLKLWDARQGRWSGFVPVGASESPAASLGVPPDAEPHAASRPPLD